MNELGLLFLHLTYPIFLFVKERVHVLLLTHLLNCGCVPLSEVDL